jgi:exosortase
MPLKLPASWRSHLPFAAACLLCAVLFLDVLRRWAALSFADARYSHIILIPLLSAGFLFAMRRRILARRALSPGFGIPLLAAAVALRGLQALGTVHLSEEYALPAAVLAFVLALAAAFTLCYGPAALKEGRFPLLFLLLMVPVPSGLMDEAIGVLQRGSAYWAEHLFGALGVPMFRHGFTFELPVVWLEVAPQCSAIHSSWALFITGVIVAHFGLRSLLAKVSLCLMTVPIAMFTNAVRIVTIWALSAYIDIGFMSGNLHRNGGIVFSLFSLSALAIFLLLLRKAEARPVRAGRAGIRAANVQ